MTQAIVTGKSHVALAFLAGGGGALGLAPYGLWPLTLISLAAAMLLFDRTQTPRQAAWTGWAYGTGYFGFALSWIVEPFFVDAARHGWMAPFALVLLPGGLALFWAAAFGLAHRARRARGLALVIALAIAEMARAYVFTGFPWAGLAQIWVGVGPDQVLSLIGPHGLGVLTLLAGLALARAVQPGPPGRRLAGLAAVVLGVGAGLWVQTLLPEPALRPETVRLVQPNARQDLKWDPEMIPFFLERKLAFTAADPRPDLIVWPETALPYLLEEAGPLLSRIAETANGATVMAGVLRRASGLGRYHNALMTLSPDGTVTQIYDKHHLVPFGEYVPLLGLARRVGWHGLANRFGGSFVAGAARQSLELGPLGRATGLICYEAVFPQLSMSDAPRAFIVQVTNDAWFGTHSGPYQHLAQARMRAIEQGQPMLRAANTGISAVIDPRGRVLAEVPLGEAGFVDARLPAPLPRTVYGYTGDWPMGLVLLATLLWLNRHRIGHRIGLRARRQK